MKRMGRSGVQIAVLVAAISAATAGVAQTPENVNRRPMTDATQTASPAPHRTRLYMKDGSYQIVMNYQVKGKVVSYLSAEREQSEDVPYDLVDWDATRKWEQQHPADGEAPAPAIDPELLKEEADRAALTPEVAKDLNLPEQDSVLALDYYEGTPELVPLAQSEGELNRVTGHSILKLSINPRAASHEIASLKGVESPIQVHVASPVIYMRLDDGTAVDHGGTPLVVDTHGAGSLKDNSLGDPTESGYVIVRADVRTDSRVLASFNISALSGKVQTQEDVTDTTTEVLPGGHWMKITPSKPLDFGEYALMEVLSDRDVNLGVWDFGVHPTAPENRDVLKPAPKRPVTLERR